MAEISENGKPTEASEGHSTPGNALLRPSAFKPSPNSGIIAPSRLGNPFAARHPEPASSEGVVLSKNPFSRMRHTPGNDDSAGESTPSKFTLRPSALDKQTASLKHPQDGESSYKSSFKLDPVKIQSPLTSMVQSKEDGNGVPVKEGNSEEAADNPESAALDQTNEARPRNLNSDEIAQRLFGGVSAQSDSFSSSSPPGSDTTNNVFGSNLSERIKGSSAVNSKVSPVSAGGFVFGQNLSQRVVNTPHKDREKPDEKEEKAAEEEESNPDPPADDGSPKPTLEESAAKYEASKHKPELAPVDVRTGEEEESNVFQFNVKLFIFDQTTQTWIERGRGLLRLNDMSDDDSDVFQSRLVMRTQGSLRVVLNTKIWAGMIIERASHKAIRVSAKDIDGDGVKIFLIMANPKDTDQIFSAIDSRVQQLKVQDTQVVGEDDEGCEVAFPAAVRDATHEESQSSDVSAQTDKRQNEASDDSGPMKKRRVDVDQPRDPVTEESNDSSTVDPETEASNESFASSPTVKSSSSDA